MGSETRKKRAKLFTEMSKNLETEIIGGRSLRSRKSLALKSKVVAFGRTTPKKENVEPVTPRATAKTPARRSVAPRKSTVPGETPSKTPAKRTVLKAKSFAEVKASDEEVLASKREIEALQKELAEMRRDKTQVEEQLKEALDVPIPTIAERDEEESEKMKNELNQLTAEKETALAEAEERERLYQVEREKLEGEMNKWKGQFEAFRETEVERLKREEESDEKRNEEFEAKLIERNKEIEKLRAEQERIETEKNEKEAKSDALDSMLEGLRSKLENVDLARKTASDQSENNKKLVEDIRDTYEDKLASLAKKCEQWRREADKQNETAKRLREERNKYRDRCDDFRRKGTSGSTSSSSSSDKSRLEQNENGLDMLRQAYKESNSRDSAKSVDSAKSSSSRNKSVYSVLKCPPRDPRKRESEDRELEELVITSQFTNSRSTRTVLAEGELPPAAAAKAPLRVAMEPFGQH